MLNGGRSTASGELYIREIEQCRTALSLSLKALLKFLQPLWAL